MEFAGCQPQVIPRFGSLCQWDSPAQLPLGLAQRGRNLRYTAQSVGTRYGLSTRLQVSKNNPLSLGAVRYLAQDNSNKEVIELLAYTQNDGNLSSLLPFEQSSLTPLTTAAFLKQANLALAPNTIAAIIQAANKGVIAISDGVLGQAPGLIYDPSQGTVDQLSDRPFAEPWQPSTNYRVGQVVSPSTFTNNGVIGAQGSWVAQQTGFVFQCIQAGTSAADDTLHDTQPDWPTTIDATVTDGTVKWQECTPIALAGLPDPAAPFNPTTAPNSGSPITAGATVYLACTMVNAQGEGINELIASFGPNLGQLDPTRMLVWQNTSGGAVNLTVTLPAIAALFSTSGPLGASFGATKLNLYVFIVPGTPDPDQIIDPTFYAQVAGGPFNPGSTVTISAFPSGQQLPTVNTAVLTLNPGNVPTGVRYMVELFETRTDYQTGMSNSGPVRINVTNPGQQITLLRGVTGPYNCEARVFAFTVAGASAAGPFTYVDQQDTESPGFNEPNVNITATRIEDNLTTFAMFNITDTYLPGATDVTNYFSRILVPAFVDAYYSKTLQSLIIAGAAGYPSTLLVSDLQDIEAFRIPGSNLDVAINDGDRVICYREVRNIGIAFKENSAHSISSNDGDPSTWGAKELWQGMGPAGPKAIDVSAEDNSQFAVFAHESGLYLYEGIAPKLISREMKTEWKLIDWSQGGSVVVKIDQERRQVRVSAPLTGGGTTLLTMDYFFGVADPVVFITRRGVLVPNPDGRKWSIDDIAASDMLYVPQRTKSEMQVAGLDITNQMIFGSADGSIKTVTDNQYYDQDYNSDQVGIYSQWIGVPGPNPANSVIGLEGASMSATGAGYINVYAVNEKFEQTGILYPLSGPGRLWFLGGTESALDFGAAGALDAFRWGVGFDNGGVAGAWFEMHVATLQLLKKWATAPG